MPVLMHTCTHVNGNHLFCTCQFALISPPPGRSNLQQPLDSVCLAQVGMEWQPLLRSIIDAYQAVYGKELLGVYLRGSLPQGLFLQGVSDVDTYALVLEGNSTHNKGSNMLALALRQRIQATAKEHAHLKFTKVGRNSIVSDLCKLWMV